MKKYYIPLFLGVLFLPFIAHAAVRINEVAWMGTADSQYSEWIELYNDAEETVSLAGWKLSVNGSELLYTLGKEIAGKGYLLIERTTGSAPDAVPGITDEAGTFGSGGLSNSGENLSLKDSQGTVVDTLSYASGWPAGDATTKDTMQWNGGQWITAPATPDQENAAQATVVSTEETENSDSTDTSQDSESKTTVTSGGTSSTTKKSAPVEPIKKKPEILITAPKNMFQGAPNEFTATIESPDTMKTPQGYYYWNMGDGTTYVQTQLSPIGYTYHYEGSYTVTVAYYDSPAASKPVLQTSVPVVVTMPAIVITAINNGSAMEITNTSSTSVDIGQWSITTTAGTRVLPPLTAIAAHARIVISAATVGLDLIQEPVLRTPDGTQVSK